MPVTRPRSTTLTLESTGERYSTYLDADGEPVHLTHGFPPRRLVDLADLDLSALWNKTSLTPEWACDCGCGTTRSGTTRRRWRTPSDFLDHLRTLLVDPDEADEIGFCASHTEPFHEDDLYHTHGDESVCGDCLENYWMCERCEDRFTQTVTVGSDEYCESCLNYVASYCDECDEYYFSDDGCGGDHEDGGCCESPAQEFTIRNDGLDPLSNDERVTVTLPAGTISDEGISAIQRYLMECYWATEDPAERLAYNDLRYRITELGDKWQTREGNYTKRLSRFAYKELSLKLKPEIVSHIGNIATQHSATGTAYEIAVTRDLNQSAEAFGHEDSCWWQSYSSSRCTLKTNGGFGLRTFAPIAWSGNDTSGRAWVMPLKQDRNGDLIPTFETLTPAAFVVFNGYGTLSGYAPARIMSHLAGMTYRKITFSGSPMYVNGTMGYLIAPEEIANTYTDGELHLSVSQHATLHSDEKELTHA